MFLARQVRALIRSAYTYTAALTFTFHPAWANFRASMTRGPRIGRAGKLARQPSYPILQGGPRRGSAVVHHRWSTGPGTVYSLLRVEDARLFRVQCRPCTDPCKTHVGKILAVPIFAVPPSDGISRYVCANALPTHGSHAHVRPSVLPRSSAHVDAVLP